MRSIFVLIAAILLVGVRPAWAAGPVWTVRSIDQFQDNFAADGTLTGVVRADMANDILPDSSPGIQPGDSSVVFVADPVFGLATDGVLGGKAVYCYVLVQPFAQPAKVGAALSGGTRWPLAGTEVIGGHTWTKLRLDQSDLGGGPVPDNYCIDLNDNLFTPSDTVFFFYAAKSNDGPGSTNYFSLEFGTTSDITIAAALPMEFTCLPAGGFNRGGDILYVDAADGTDSQIYWEMAFRFSTDYDSRIDRYDVRGPADGAHNRPASRVVNVAGQLSSAYRVLFWESGPFNATIGDGSTSTLKTDDYALFNTFLGNLTNIGGILLFGDDVAEQLAASTSPSATTFKLYMPFVLVSGNHAALFGSAPTGAYWPGRCFLDNVLIFGAGAPAHDFDVLQATGPSRLEMTYGPNGTTNGAVVSNWTVTLGTSRVVELNGFGLASVRDDDTNGFSDRASFLFREALCAAAGPFHVAGVSDKPVPPLLAQNYPNPFNPVTTIRYSLTARGRVTIMVYDIAGRRVRLLTDETVPPGAHDVWWDGRDDAGREATSGVYFYRLSAPGVTQTKKMVLLK